MRTERVPVERRNSADGPLDAALAKILVRRIPKPKKRSTDSVFRDDKDVKIPDGKIGRLRQVLATNLVFFVSIVLDPDETHEHAIA
jgi:hypothetical protein